MCCAQSLSRVQLFVAPWTVAHQVPLSMRFPRQKCWSGLPFPSPGIKPASPAWQEDFLPLSHLGSLIILQENVFKSNITSWIFKSLQDDIQKPEQLSPKSTRSRISALPLAIPQSVHLYSLKKASSSVKWSYEFLPHKHLGESEGKIHLKKIYQSKSCHILFF